MRPTHPPRAASRLTLPSDAPRNRWQALRNRLNHASYADWPRLCWQAATGHPPVGSPFALILAG
jgi:hypothetical protein